MLSFRSPEANTHTHTQSAACREQTSKSSNPTPTTTLKPSWRPENDDIWNALPTKHQKEIQPPKLEFTSRETDEELNSLYKEVAKQTHPDLNENRDEMFIEAKEALEQNNWAKMCNLAELLGIDTPNPTYAMVQRLEHSVKTLERTINEIRLTVIWVWFHEKNVHKRNVIFTDFINHLNQQAK